MAKEGKEKKRGLGAGRIILILAALAVFAYSGWNLYKILSEYHRSDVAYETVNRYYTVRNAKAIDEAAAPDIKSKFEDAEPPMSVDWEELRKVNRDIVAWICAEFDDDISYPVCWREDDDDFYLHRSYTREYLYAGAIFLEGLNNPDFADPVSIVYGHNMKNGSMFAGLKHLKDQETYEKRPYFWILTPQGNYRYHIYSAFVTDSDSGVYQLFAKQGQKFLDWERQIQNASEVKNDVPLFYDDYSVVLSTCESDHVHRTVVIGRCVSSGRPVRTQDYTSLATKGNSEAEMDAYEEEYRMSAAGGEAAGEEDDY